MKEPDLTDNIIFTFDSYKDLHRQMLEPNVTRVYSYLEARVGAEYPNTTFFGGQFINKKWLVGPVVTKQKIDDAEPYLHEHFKFNGKVWDRRPWDYIADNLGGYLPLEIRSVDEGTTHPVGSVLQTYENTDDNCAWLSCGLETVLQQVWYASTVCTRDKIIVDKIRKYFRETVDDELQWLADFYLHDFGQRGVSCMEQAGIGGMAHLVNSKGTDTKMGMAYAIKYYGAKKEGLAYSVAASEHSIACQLGRERQYEVTKRLLNLFNKGIFSGVSDTYNIEEAIVAYNYDPEFKKIILGRDGKFVARPDSPRFKGDKPQDQILWITKEWDHGYGHTINSKGYKDLDPHVGTIYGDSLTENNIGDALELLKQNGYSALACVFGCGGYLLQKLHRDTQRFAVKASAQKRDGVWYDLFKEPLDKSKASKRGRFDSLNLTRTLLNGKIEHEYTFDEVRQNAKL
jgi:nicotinamide phosphoribosyltransferase